MPNQIFQHQRFDVDHDIPDAYLPEFPPPLFLTTRPDLGDVSQGQEITQANFRQLFNGAIEMDPGVRPTLARARLDTPSLRGDHINRLFSLKRSIRSLDHFSEVEEYFDGDPAFQIQIGGRQLDKPSTNRMGDFQSLVAFPPAPKLDRFGRLDPKRASPAELRGEKLFNGKARCFECHPAPFYTDNQMHDLRVEEFYPGRAEGWAKTFSLRGIKDSPPHFHDGRLPTLEDTVEFFTLIFGVQLTAEEKSDVTAFLRVL